MSAPASKPKVGNEPWKIILLAALVVVGGLTLYLNVFAGDQPAPARPGPQAAAPAIQPELATAAEAPRREPGRSSTTGGEFKPRIGYARPEDRPDPATVDPSIRLDLLARVQAVELAPTNRNIFQYGAAPPPPAPPKPIELPKNTPKIPVTPPPVATNAPPATAPPPPPPQAPPMTFKYYGFKVAKLSGMREAFLLDGDEILIGGENQTLKSGRYRIVRISPNTITIEDTQFKANQTITLQEEAAPPA